MATDAEAAGDDEVSPATEPVGEGAPPDEGVPADQVSAEDDEDTHYFVEVYNDYDPSQRFVSIFPVGERQGAKGSSVAYYIIEPGNHSGLHSDNAEEVVFVAEGEGEVFVIGATKRLEAGKFVVFPAGVDHDIYAHGAVALRLLSFFPTTEIQSTFQQVVYPMGGNVVSSKPPDSQGPVLTELDPNNLPEDFPFDLADLGLSDAPRELTPTEIALGMTEPGVPPPDLNIRVIDPSAPDEPEGPVGE